MKNIHVLPTDKPSRLYNCFGKLEIGDYVTTRESLQVTNQNIYITSDEEIKEEDWYYLPRTNSVHKCIEDPAELNLERRLGVAKIILTTDQDLIKDGVQAIDDEFLEWFVKNPSFEFVEVTEYLDSGFSYGYKIIIPKEEPKQETLEEVAKNATKMYVNEREKQTVYLSFIEGAKWQQERMYSEEELHNAFYNGWLYRGEDYQFPKAKKEWFKQFKNK